MGWMMKRREFTREVARILPTIHAAIVRGQPGVLMKGKITMPQMVILDILRVRGESKMSDISNAIRVTKSAVTGMVDRLIKSDMVERSRSGDDRRIVLIKLTKYGKSISKKIADYKVKIVSNLFSTLNSGEKKEYLRILKKIQKNITSGKGTQGNE